MLLDEHGLARVAAPLLALARDCIALQRTPATDAIIPVGATKLGGRPDLPSTVAWPEHAGLPYSFLCQVDCAAAAPLDPTGLLPRSGLLSFFLLLAAEEYWEFPLVLYHDAERLERAAEPVWPADATSWASSFFPELVLPACHAMLTSDLSLAGPSTPRVKAVGMGDDERQRYWDLVQELGPVGVRWSPKTRGFVYPPLGSPADHAGHQLFGNPATVQGEPCELEGPAESHMLLQLASDYHPHFCWGDTGILTWCIRAADLRRRDFQQAAFNVDMS